VENNGELSIPHAYQFSAIFKNSQFTCEAKLTVNRENQWRIVNSLYLSIFNYILKFTIHLRSKIDC